MPDAVRIVCAYSPPHAWVFAIQHGGRWLCTWCGRKVKVVW